MSEALYFSKYSASQKKSQALIVPGLSIKATIHSTQIIEKRLA